MICPCQRQQINPTSYASCCQAYHEGKPVNDCQQLMRSRFSAYVLGLRTYLLNSWHSSTRPETLSDDADDHWLKLDILNATKHTVHFKAYSHDEHGFSVLEEVSNFDLEQGRWVYVDGDVSISPYIPGRNDPCLCGSGKKFKKCCMSPTL